MRGQAWQSKAKGLPLNPNTWEPGLACGETARLARADRQLSKFPCLRFYFGGFHSGLLRSRFFVFTGLPSSQTSALLLSDLAERGKSAWDER